MSNPNQQNPQNPWPVYGQGSSSGQNAPSGDGQPGSWPVYGEPGSGGYPPQGAPSPGQYSPSQYPPGPNSASGAGPDAQPPAGGPFAAPQYGAAGPPGMYPTQTGPTNVPGTLSPQLPSRTAPILLIALGAVMMVIIAPIVMVSVLLSGVGLNQIVDQSLQTSNGGVVTVDSSGTLGVITTSSGQVTCALENSSGSTQMALELDGSMLVARNMTPGEYTLICEGLSTSDTIVVMDGGALDAVFPATMSAFGWATAVGVIGLGVLVGGIVWLVKRNKERKALLPTYNMYGRGGPYGPGGYGGPQGA